AAHQRPTVARRIPGRRLRPGDREPLRRPHQAEGGRRTGASMKAWRWGALAALLMGVGEAAVTGQQNAVAAPRKPWPGLTAGGADERKPNEAQPPSRFTQLEQLQYALLRLPIAAGLATVLAVRPRRRGTPRRQLQVIQTQIILAVVGAVVMLVV